VQAKHTVRERGWTGLEDLGRPDQVQLPIAHRLGWFPSSRIMPKISSSER